MKGPDSQLRNWFNSDFFELGAFITDATTQEIILAKGGYFEHDTHFVSTPCFYLKDFFSDTYLCYRPEKWLRTTPEEILAALVDLETIIEITETNNLDQIYAEDFNTLKNTFGPQLEKVVLVSREEFKVKEPAVARKSLFLKALNFGTGLPYGIWNDQYGVVGSTPEILFSIKEKKLFTFALAGTSQVGDEEKLMTSVKDRTEHDLVVQDIKEKLASFCSSISNSATEIATYKNIIHLKTNIEGTITDGIDLAQLTSLMSPTAALGGYPKKESLKFLKSTRYQALYPQRYFGSTLGLISEDIKQFIVSIRNIQWNDQKFIVESGGGVLPASELCKELAEISLKRETIKRHYL